MNQRIRELRTQAAAWVAENHQPQDPNAYSQKEIDQRYLMYEEKFAEFIVQECVEICRSEDWEDQQGWGKLYAHKIKKHFEIK